MLSATKMTSDDLLNHLNRDHSDLKRKSADVQLPQADLLRLDREDRAALVREICERLPAHINERGMVMATAVRQITDELYAWVKEHQQTPPRRRTHVHRAEAIIASLNALPGLTILLPTRAVLMPRPSHAPSSVEQAQGLAAMIMVDRHLDDWRQHTKHKDRWLLTLAVRLGSRLGMGQEVVLGTLAMLGTRHVDKTDRLIRLPSQRQDGRAAKASERDTQGLDGNGPMRQHSALDKHPINQPMGYYSLTLPRAVIDPLKHLLHEASGNQCDWLALESPGKEIPKLKTRQQQLRKRLDHAAKAMIKEMKKQYPDQHATLKRLSGWLTMSRYAPLVAQRKGMASVWLDILSNYPLPTDSREPITQGVDRGRYAPGGRFSNHHAHHHDQDADSRNDNEKILPSDSQVRTLQTDDLAITAPGGTDVSVEPLSIEQAFALRHAVAEFSRTLPTLTTINKLSAKVYREPLQQLRKETAERLTEIVGTEDSLGHWLVAFACHRLVVAGDKISSVRTFLTRLMPPPLLLNDAIADVPGWDQDSIDELCDEGQSYERWGYNTRQHFLRTMGMFVDFCQDYGILDDVISPAASEARISTRRTRMVNPEQMDQAWRTLVGHQHPSQTNTQFALALALGYYAGLRASEVCQLTLRDVRIEYPDHNGEWSALHGVFARGRNSPAQAGTESMVECWVYIRQGKTPAARRRIPLHLLAPPDVIQCLARWWTTRRDVAPTHALRDIGLFGPLFSPQAYSRQGLIDPLLVWLRQQWGAGVDFHGLRHCAASWWQLRLHAAQHADFRESMHYRFHWMFQPAALDRFLTYLCGPEGNEAIEKGTLIGQLVKLIGHRHVNTLLHTYNHSLGLIHSHALHTTWSNRKAPA
ncbi:hypothetical protein [Halomonas sp.]|uniref:hypothetical protein n=1 Tax=Halomonas sp. TaxID=1486246 RepID=UPI00298DD866|nr:hypothetical protein [Halomonas sp.]MDW7748627.1 hypothetical protein [Halomonas sp.]